MTEDTAFLDLALNLLPIVACKKDLLGIESIRFAVRIETETRVAAMLERVLIAKLDGKAKFWADEHRLGKGIVVRKSVPVVIIRRREQRNIGKFGVVVVRIVTPNRFLKLMMRMNW